MTHPAQTPDLETLDKDARGYANAIHNSINSIHGKRQENNQLTQEQKEGELRFARDANQKLSVVLADWCALWGI